MISGLKAKFDKKRSENTSCFFSPGKASISNLALSPDSDASVAQRIEQQPSKLSAVGSSPT